MNQDFYKVTNFEKFLCKIVNFLVSTSKVPRYIRTYLYKKLIKLSNKKYKREHCLLRYYQYKYRGQFIGRYTYGFEDILLNENIKFIGSFSSIAKNLFIVPNSHKLNWITTSPILALKDFGFSKKDLIMEYYPYEKREVVIGNDVWIGANCIIFEGVKIGDGAVIAAGSIVRHDVPPLCHCCIRG